ncbi:SLC13 family permease [Desulfoluna spongiiphila]|uniref:Solute carrier family 13 (Sodium-dependent dicarboxylate transporter), member 2/3/5 n=1 Tax=Desulfoluna spongiiphila TaxID=419481 RepID=A0A1G5IUL5_9BACT|nr:SLC13 family permease [Desulfoluna spongiiphila]SCY79762.1 solute carrier family 13 (sodium-dependent dicarboxylate transporter), member 2/3/5 [Desulfoluna spongiiphila]VVS93347.1 citrate carrier citt-related [Desulfoluna spongiiphila]
MVTETLQAETRPIDWKRIFFLALGLGLFTLVYYSSAWPDAIDPNGERFVLTTEAKGAIAVFLLAGIWWVFEVLPIGITSLTIGVLQVMFMIRPANAAFKDFMAPSVLFIFASLVIGMVFTKTGLTRRIAYKMLSIVGERTSMIYLGCFMVTAALTHIMAHTAVAATMYPLLLTIHAMYADDRQPTRFGKGLFIGMAYVAGAGSIITLLGAARGAVAIGFFKDIVGREITFFGLSYYMFPVGWVMVFILWAFVMLFFRPEKQRIEGIKERSAFMLKEMGAMSRTEVVSAIIIFLCILALSLRAFIPALAGVNKTAIILVSTILFFVLNILDIKDLEAIPWNIILLFGGAMSIGFCLWETGAAQWMAVNWLTLFKEAHWFVFVMSIAFFVMVMTNFIMNVAAIAISLPVALVIAPYLGVAPEVILFASLITSGMPFILLVGAAPNAIAYDSGQFTTGEFFTYGLVASLILMVITALFVLVVWPMMGMPVLLP